jgi:hypothetical protein
LYVYDYYPQESTLETSKSVLVGLADRIAGFSDINEVVKGWVPSDRVTFWLSRVAVEMNSDEEAVKERKFNETPVLIFGGTVDGMKYAKSYQERKIKAKSAKNYTFKGNYSTKRKIGTWMRFPVLKDLKNEKIYELGVMGEITNNLGDVIIERDTFANIMKIYQEKIKGLRNVNIVFVIDGTTSMQPYFTALSSALEDIISKIGVLAPLNKLRFGATVYRDAAEGSRLIENSPVSEDKKQLINFLRHVQAKDIYDKDKPEAVFYGLKSALMSQFKSKDETNILILIGDAGNHAQTSKTKVDPNILSKLIEEYKCAFLSYQVHNDGDPTYTDFQNQIKNIIKTAADELYNKEKESFASTGISYPPPKFTEVQKNILRLDNYPPMAVMVNSPVGGTIEPDLLRSEIDELITFSQNYLEKRISYFENIIRQGKTTTDIEKVKILHKSGGSINSKEENKYVSSYAPGILDMLYSLGVDGQTLKKLSQEKFQLYTKGYAPKIIFGENNPLFKRTLLLTQQELYEIIINLEKLYDAFNSDDRRTALVNSWLELLRKYYGNKDEVNLKRMNLGEIQEKVLGIKSEKGNTLIYRYTLEDLMDPSVVSDKEIQNYRLKISKKYKMLKYIAENPKYDYQFYSNGVTYYWLIEDYLP